MAAIALSAPPASAAPPVRESVVDEFSFVDTELCPFPVVIEGRAEYRATLHRNPDTGLLRRVNLHGTEELSYSANGQTLEADPFPYNIHITFGPEGGAPRSNVVTGLVLRVPLPDGTTFLSAGRLDFVVTGQDFAATPQVGLSGDLDALCGALS
ncbi:hypothetical protein [Georgenia satyanarayanai]|uniref:hypothetical protein n=1 Tax=Georgenia satyanarayanai TaxID=860221 RepID=UPI0011B5906A|nr:hypothetical protein [Georgenia satyanarayanai]